ncbi:hypothetical protein PENTCL1PPCAC_18839, partial [Pristionchus entomophagus]
FSLSQMPHIIVSCKYNEIDEPLPSLVYVQDHEYTVKRKLDIPENAKRNSWGFEVKICPNAILNILEPLGWKVVSMAASEGATGLKTLSWTLHKEITEI